MSTSVTRFGKPADKGDQRTFTTPKDRKMRKRIRNLHDHPESYVTTSELAEYWMVSRSQIYKHIEAGTLRAIRLGPRLLRISTHDALDFEKRAKLTPEQHSSNH